MVFNLSIAFYIFPILMLTSLLLNEILLPSVAQSAETVEYADCISTEG